MAKSTKTKSIIFVVSGCFLALLIGTAVFLFINFKIYKIDGTSMEPTYKTGMTIITRRGNHSLNRGDVVIIEFPNTASPDHRRDGIKRIVALPGERVVIQNGKITVYNNSSPQGFNPDDTYGLRNIQTQTPSNESIDMVMPQGSVYVLGDNRSNSLDSRIFGPLPIDNILRKVL